MRIKKIQIKNFKSLVDFELNDLKPFCAFVGPNASGKSNVFEALELLNLTLTYGIKATNFIGNKNALLSYSSKDNFIGYKLEFDNGLKIHKNIRLRDGPFEEDEVSEEIFDPMTLFFDKSFSDQSIRSGFISDWKKSGNKYGFEFEQFVDSFSRIFVGKLQNRPKSHISKLGSSASNLSQIIGLILQNNEKHKDFVTWVKILIPEFENIDIKQSNIDGEYEFFIYEKGNQKPFPKYLISDGTYNILSLMAAVYQTEEPQFLCIEEPENGLHPQAIELLVDFFREKCEEKGHHIWLNTHSQTLVRCMEIDEIILVNKIDGQTRAKQLTKNDKIDIRTDEAWLSNALGGGVL